MATHASILAWGIPWREEPRGLQFPGPQKVERERAIKQPPTGYWDHWTLLQG